MKQAFYLTTRKYFFRSFSFVLWLSNLHV